MCRRANDALLQAHLVSLLPPAIALANTTQTSTTVDLLRHIAAWFHDTFRVDERLADLVVIADEPEGA